MEVTAENGWNLIKITVMMLENQMGWPYHCFKSSRAYLLSEACGSKEDCPLAAGDRGQEDSIRGQESLQELTHLLPGTLYKPSNTKHTILNTESQTQKL